MHPFLNSARFGPNIALRIAGLLTVCALTILAGCGEVAEDGEVVGSEGDPAGPRVTVHTQEALEPSSPVRMSQDPILRLGTVTGPEEERFQRVDGAVSLSDGSVAVLDAGARAILVFGEDGELTRRLGDEAGEGPRLRLPQYMTVMGTDTLLVWDAGEEWIAGFHAGPGADPDVQARGWVVEVALPPEVERVVALHTLASGQVALVALGSRVSDQGSGGLHRQDAFLLFLEEFQGGEEAGMSVGVVQSVEVAGPGFILRDQHEAGAPDEGPAGTAARVREWFHPALLTAAQEDWIWHSDGTDGLLQGWRPGEATVGWRMELELPPITTADEVEGLHAWELEETGDDEERRERVRGRQADRAYPDRLPPLRLLRADALGRLWIGLTQLPPRTLPAGGGPLVREWLVLKEDGELMGRVSLPVDGVWLAADSHGVLILRFDALDLPFVERFTLDGP